MISAAPLKGSNYPRWYIANNTIENNIILKRKLERKICFVTILCIILNEMIPSAPIRSWKCYFLPLEEIMTTNQPTDEHEGSRRSYTNLICIKNSFLIPFVPSLTPWVRRASWVRHGRSNIRPLMQEFPLMCVLFKLKWAMHFWFWRECKILHWAAEIKKLCGPRVNEFHCFSACKLSSNFVGCFNFSEI